MIKQARNGCVCVYVSLYLKVDLFEAPAGEFLIAKDLRSDRCRTHDREECVCLLAHCELDPWKAHR